MLQSIGNGRVCCSPYWLERQLVDQAVISLGSRVEHHNFAARHSHHTNGIAHLWIHISEFSITSRKLTMLHGAYRVIKPVLAKKLSKSMHK